MILIITFTQILLKCLNPIIIPINYPEIYDYVCKQIPSNEILFIDDKQENLDAAKLFGMDTILFTSNDYADGLIEEKINHYLK